MSNEICAVKRKLDDAISQLCDVSWMFVKNRRVISPEIVNYRSVK